MRKSYLSCYSHVSTATLNELTGRDAMSQEENPTHEVIKDEVCWANVRDSGSEKWDIRSGAKVTFLEDEGSYTRIRTSEGIECSLASDAIRKI
ncbi:MULTISPECIES: hypothetical protein [Sinorhizobium]|uniref:hypothetical protein n=1 Tax=Sinorhizobium TaxID=28105 RepID=UPI0024B2802C|nr:hypothetical protein [Sinorhizobium terangae]WFU51885.1 hypothetical protein QA637_28635 [Sinorhizobium terangae]